MVKSLFPELVKPELKDMCGLRVVKVITNLHDAVRTIQCVDEQGELHEITFTPIDSSYIAVELDGSEVCNLETEV
jgi:hypothetical protein